jgi:hypothetical protein
MHQPCAVLRQGFFIFVMADLTPLSFSAACTAAGTVPALSSTWVMSIIGEPEAGLLLRVLQRLLVQQAVVNSLRYTLVDGEARLIILFHADEDHASLAARRCETLIAVHRVSLEISR